MGRRQHFVPRFYLREFASAPRRINVFNIRRGIAVANVSLRDQCYAPRLYGPDDEVENALAVVEGHASRVISTIMRDLTAPAAGSAEHDVLVAFLALQLARTIDARTRAQKMSGALGEAAFEGNPPREYEVGPDEAVAMMLAIAPRVARTLNDLAVSLVMAAPGTAFVTSDNPAFKYNLYCEGAKHMGVTGTICRGFQLFMPLSPDLLLHLYDAGVYKVGSRRSTVVAAQSADVQSLNRLQFMSANENVYYRDWSVTEDCRKLAKSTQRLRDQDRPRVNVAVESQNAPSQLLHQYWPMPQLALCLSFLRLQRNARRIPLADRAQRVRAAHRSTEASEETWTGDVRRFMTPMNMRDDR